MIRLLRAMPFFRLLAIGQTVLLARRHFSRLNGDDRRRLAELVRKGRAIDNTEREELRTILGKLEPKEFAFATANRFSPLPLRRFMR
jgi:hypothetical protein